jgi:hypothetical protein
MQNANLIWATVVAMLVASIASADPIDHNRYRNGSDSVDSQNFSNANPTVGSRGDTANWNGQGTDALKALDMPEGTPSIIIDGVDLFDTVPPLRTLGISESETREIGPFHASPKDSQQKAGARIRRGTLVTTLQSEHKPRDLEVSAISAQNIGFVVLMVIVGAFLFVAFRRTHIGKNSVLTIDPPPPLKGELLMPIKSIGLHRNTE